MCACLCVYVCACLCVYVCVCLCVCVCVRERENNSLPSDSKALCVTAVGDTLFTGMLQDIKAQEKVTGDKRAATKLELETYCMYALK